MFDRIKNVVFFSGKMLVTVSVIPPYFSKNSAPEISMGILSLYFFFKFFRCNIRRKSKPLAVRDFNFIAI